VALDRATLRARQSSLGQAAHGRAVETLAEFEVLGQSVARGEHRLLDLFGPEAELRADLTDAKSLQLAQHVNGALSLGQCAQRGDEVDALRVCVERVFGSASVTIQQWDDVAASLDHFERGVAGDPVHPGAEVIRRAASTEGLIRVQQRRLRDILACRRVGEHPSGVARERSAGRARRTRRLGLRKSRGRVLRRRLAPPPGGVRAAYDC
jgi:hypothetical protein